MLFSHHDRLNQHGVKNSRELTLGMIAPTIPPVPHWAATAAAAATAQPVLAERQILITQTITSDDSVYTTVVTLGRGDGDTATGASQPQATVAPSSENSTSSTSSGGLTQQQIGIIVGCCVGAVVFLFLVWFCLNMMRRRRIIVKNPPTPEYTETNWSSSYISDMTRPDIAPWTSYYRVRPPLSPQYRAVDPQYQPNTRGPRRHYRYARRERRTSSSESSST